MEQLTFEQRLAGMTADELILAVGEMEALQRQAGWRAILGVLGEDGEVADGALHTSRADDVVAVAMSQATCAAIDRMLEMPGTMVRRYREAISGG